MLYTVDMQLIKYVQVEFDSDDELLYDDIMTKARWAAIQAYGVFDEYEICDYEYEGQPDGIPWDEIMEEN